MKPFFIALVLLFTYLVLVFVTSRLLDLVSWWQQGVPSSAVMDPLLLSVRQLKQLLEIRGVSYTGCLEKQELVDLVQASADVVKGEVDALTNYKDPKEKISMSPDTSKFAGGAHFYEEVEDTKDSVWLVQVLPMRREEYLLDDYNWRIVQHHLSPFAIRTGLFDCRLDPELCISKGWDEPLLLLALPRGGKPKDKVVLRTFRISRPQAVFEWLRKELSIWVKRVSSWEEVEEHWLGANISAQSSQSSDVNTSVRVLLLTHLLHPPLFLAALSIKFTGRIKFGMFSVKKEDLGKTGKVPTYLIITPEKTVVYGRRNMEHFNVHSMNLYLKALQPSMNDVFIFSLLFVNMFTLLHVLQLKVETWWSVLVSLVWRSAFNNLILFSLWLLVYGSASWQVVSLASDWGISIIRRAALSDLGSLFWSDWVRLFQHSWLLMISFLGFVSLTARRLFVPSSRPRHIPTSPAYYPPHPTDLDQVEFELLERLMDRLPIPQWLFQSFIPTGYIENLPLWEFKGKKPLSEEETLKNLMDKDDTSTGQVSQSDSEFESSSGEPEAPGFIKTSKCAICFDRYKCGNMLCGLPCGHSYHKECVFRWLQERSYCPLCRWPAYQVKPNMVIS